MACPTAGGLNANVESFVQRGDEARMHRGRPDQTVHSESGNLDSARGLRLDSADAAVSYHPLRPQQIC